MTTDTLSPAEFVQRARRFTPRIWVTPTLVAINVAVFLLMLADRVSFFSPSVRDLVAWGGNAGVLSLRYGQTWRLVTCLFVHAGIVHIGMNMIVLWDIGRFVERLVGNAAMLIAYMLSGLVGSLAGAALHPAVVSIGASGAIFGLYGLLFGFLARHHHTIPRPMLLRLRKAAGAFVIYNLLFSVAVPGIDLWAHLGGLAGGFVAGVGIAAPLTEAGARSRLWRNALVAAVGMAALAGATWALMPHHRDAATTNRGSMAVSSFARTFGQGAS
ncbi:MAG: rhomboid family intramembrane serine protease [Opitutaceae bacterium]